MSPSDDPSGHDSSGHDMTSTVTWTAIIPIRSFAEGKTRLHSEPVPTAGLIRAFASDVIGACLACPQIDDVVVVSPDPAVCAFGRDLGCRAVEEAQALGINEAIATVRDRLGGSIVAILGDTPCLTGEVLTEVLTRAAQYPVSFVADAAGVGTTVWCAKGETRALSHFGHHSRAEHRSHGAIELGQGDASQTWARARRDVDTDVDLWDARRLGVGPATLRLLDATA